jgi:uncharacterized membrane protein
MENETMIGLLDSLPIGAIMWIVLALVTVVFIVFSAILIWHWRMYSTGKFTTVSNMVMYLTVSLFFIVLMGASATAYSFL